MWKILTWELDGAWLKEADTPAYRLVRCRILTIAGSQGGLF